jgi:arylsulfatase A-like enzyme
MKTVFLLFDSLNRLMLEPCGGTTIPTPNFRRLAERTVTFDRHYVGSMPCMPARRDLQTGRLSFLHRSWGPIEPYDNSFLQQLRDAGTYSHLITDHYHYFEDGGATYHTRYNSFDFVRGQELDPWHVDLVTPIEEIRAKFHPMQADFSGKQSPYHYMINREQIRAEADFPAVQCMDRGIAFLERNRTADDWFLQIETFDPHEPFFAPERHRAAFPTGYRGPILDWPRYREVCESEEEIAELRANYAASVALCDELLGRLLDHFDQHDLWKDTALVVTTDHGFLLGEHDWWGKNRMPLYEEISHIPLFVHHPDHAAHAGERRGGLTQTIDLMPTFCDFHGAGIPKEVRGQSLLPAITSDTAVHDAVIFGYWGGGINVTDGRYTRFCYPRDMRNQELFQYTLMPTHINRLFMIEELQDTTIAEPFDFTKGARLMKIPHMSKEHTKMHSFMFPDEMIRTETVLYDLATDPGQETPIRDAAVERRLKAALFRLMRENDAPLEAFRRMEASLGAEASG